MQDIFENKQFFLWNFLEISSFFYIFLWIFLYFFIKYIFKKYFSKNKNLEIQKNEKIDFLEKLEKISEKNFLNEFFSLYLQFLEEKIWKKEISKMTFSELQKIDFSKNMKNFYKKIYFLKYKNKILEEKEISILKEEFKEILKSNS